MPRLSCNYTAQRFVNSQKMSSCTYLCILLWTDISVVDIENWDSPVILFTSLSITLLL